MSMNKSSNVYVMSDPTTGAVINTSVNNPEWGYIKIEQSVNQYDDNGFLRRKKLFAIISASLYDLQDVGYYAGQILDGRIVTQESTTPFNKKHPERDIKVAGDTGIVCRVDGNPIYRRTIYTEKDNVKDTYIAHDNIEELRRAFSSEKANNILKPNEEFNI